MTNQIDTPAELAGATFAGALREKASTLRTELIRQTLEDAKSWADAVEAEWAKAHPGEWNGYPIPPEEVASYRATVQNEMYEWVEPAFERYLTPDPDDNNAAITALRKVEGMFAGSSDGAGNVTPAAAGLSRINDVRADMNHWEGDLQTNFIDNFVTPLQSVSVNQGVAAAAVREQLECVKLIYIRRRKCILELADKSIQAVQTLKNGRDPKSFTWGTLVGISIGTALTLSTGGLAIAGGAMIIGSTLSQGLTPQSPDQNELSAATAQEVAQNVSRAMTTTDAKTDEQETKARSVLSAITDAIGDSRAASIRSNTAGDFSVATPALSTASPGDITDGSLRPRG